MILTIDMGGTTTKFATIIKGKIINKHSILTETNNYEKYLNDIIIAINKYNLEEVEGISISLPGQINAKENLIISSGSIYCLEKNDIVHDLKQMFKKPIIIENDGNCALIAEYHYGVGKGYSNLAMVILGTGIGGAVITNDELLVTKNHFNAEFGYLILDNENLTSWEFLNGSVVKTLDYIRSLDTQYSNMKSEEIFDNYKKDPKITKVLEKFYMNLAIGIYNIQVMFDPELIIIGGGISSRKDLIANVEEKLAQIYTKREIGFNIKINTVSFGNDSNLLGAYYNFKERMNKNV